MSTNKRFSVKNILSIVSVLVLVTIAGCGGGGGSGGTPSSGVGSTTSGGTKVGATPTLVLEIRDANNAVTTSIGGSGVSTASAKLLDVDGKPVVGRLVTFAYDAALVKVSPVSGTALTDSNGVASVQIAPLSLLVSGAGSLQATALVGTVSVVGAADYQVSATNLALQNLNLGSPTLAAFGSRPVSVQVIANGSPVTSPVQVAFTANCGIITPPSVNTDGSGVASSTYTANLLNCAGKNVEISASIVGAAPLSGRISVSAAVATNIQFVKSSPELIYLRDSGAAGAATQAVVTFKVVDSNGTPLPNQSLVMSLVNSEPGVSLETLGSTAEVTQTSNSVGEVSVAVFSGTVPTPVQVRARLLANSQISTTSGILTVASGRPVQKAASIAVEKFAVEGLNYDGDTSVITLSLADRQGNPVPDGTAVNFVAQSGVMIPPRCVVAGGTSQCKSTIRTSGTRPANGLVSILAYVQGEEDFVDANRNNVYDDLEAFTDLGNAYRSDINNARPPSANAMPSNYRFRDSAGDFSVPRAGSQTCPGGESGVPNTCDDKWGANEVRKQALVIFSGSEAVITLSTANPLTANRFYVNVADALGHSVATGSSVVADKSAGSSESCAVKLVFPTIIPNSYDPAEVSVSFEKCAATDSIDVTVTSPVTKTVVVRTFRVQ